MPSSFLGDGNLTLDDFSKPPELQNNTSNTNSGQINSSSQGAGAGLLAASQSQHHSQPMSISHSHSQPMSSYPGLTLPSQQHLASQEMMGTQSQLLTQEEPVTAAAHHLHQLSSQQQAYPHAPQFQGAHAINNSQQSWVPSSQGGLPSQQQAAPQRAVPPITFQVCVPVIHTRGQTQANSPCALHTNVTLDALGTTTCLIWWFLPPRCCCLPIGPSINTTCITVGRWLFVCISPFCDPRRSSWAWLRCGSWTTCAAAPPCCSRRPMRAWTTQTMWVAAITCQ
jgi:hypothetical protein